MVRAAAFGKLETTATWPVLPRATVLVVVRLEFELATDVAAGSTTIGVPGGTTLAALELLVLVGMLAVMAVPLEETLVVAGEALATAGVVVVATGEALATAEVVVVATGEALVAAGVVVVATGEALATAGAAAVATGEALATAGVAAVATGEALATAGAAVVATGETLATAGAVVVAAGEALATTGEAVVAAREALATPGEPLEPAVPESAPFATLVAVLMALPSWAEDPVCWPPF